MRGGGEKWQWMRSRRGDKRGGGVRAGDEEEKEELIAIENDYNEP